MNNKKRMHEIVKRLESVYLDAKVSLNYNNPFELLVATVLSAQTTDAAVNKVLPALFSAYPDAKSMSQAEIDELKQYIKTIGLYNNKAKSLLGLSKKIVSDFQGKVPQTMKELISLPGVGRKTANVVLGNAFGITNSGITVDTHVIRLTNRMGFVEGKNAIKIEKELMKIVPEDKWVKFTILFIDHGRAICGRIPKCNKCVLNDLCEKREYKK